MKYYKINHYDTKYIAGEDIKKGDILTKIYKRILRKSKTEDINIFGISMGNYKKGELIEVVCDCYVTNLEMLHGDEKGVYRGDYTIITSKV